jgi:5-methylcytosine-specific restriction endonuclease McrA
MYLKRHPLCVLCQRKGTVSAATCVDHKRPHHGDKALFWDVSNWQGLCSHCHSNDKQFVERNNFTKNILSNGWPADPAHPANKEKEKNFPGGDRKT